MVTLQFSSVTACSAKLNLNVIYGLFGKKGEKGVLGDRGPKGPRGSPGVPGRQGLSWTEQVVIAQLRELQMHAMALIGPLRGDKERPFTTCRELSMCRPELPDGYYYIDPNQGCAHDSIYVYCNFSAGGESCISPVQLRLHENAQMNGKSFNHWNHEQNYTQKIQYGNLSVVQLNFLRLHSFRAVQRVRYHYSAAVAAPRVGMSLQGDDGIPLSFGHPFFYVQSDSCQVSSHPTAELLFGLTKSSSLWLI
uniref:Fibrillar collagen NC1 domain-containing protein n=1 Tax=Eptatretus burgeri TaxID=7764 RepID=A0A8C4WY47_EPTBU